MVAITRDNEWVRNDPISDIYNRLYCLQMANKQLEMYRPERQYETRMNYS